MNILRIDENHLMRNSNKEIILHQMLENSEFPAKETSKIIKNKTSKFAESDERTKNDLKFKHESSETIFFSSSDFPTHQTKDSNVPTPKIIKQILPLFPSSEKRNTFIIDDNQKKKQSNSTKTPLDLDKVNISSIKLKQNHKNKEALQNTKPFIDNKSFNTSSLLSVENSISAKQKTKTMNFNKNFLEPFQQYEKSNNYKTNNNKEKPLNIYNDFTGFLSNNESLFGNQQVFYYPKKKVEQDRKNEFSQSFQNPFEYDSFQKVDTRNFLSKNSFVEHPQQSFYLPKNKDISASLNIENMNYHSLKNVFDFENEESNQLALKNPTQEDVFFIRSGERGLKYISKKAQDIVMKMKRTTFKEVAEVLINNIPFTPGNNFKEKQNIKRRVYDALNVLVAMDVLQKKGKEISINQKHLSTLRKPINYKTKDMDKLKNTFGHNIMEKKQTIEKKRENFVEIFSKLFSIQILTHRNLEAFKKLEEKASNSKVFNNINENIFFSAEIPKQEFSPENQNKEIYLQDIVSSIEKQETIQIPFILVEFQDLQDVGILRDKNKNLEIISKKGMNIFGDIDILRKMEVHKKFYQKQLIDKLLPREIYQYLPEKMIKDMI